VAAERLAEGGQWRTVPGLSARPTGSWPLRRSTATCVARPMEDGSTSRPPQRRGGGPL